MLSTVQILCLIFLLYSIQNVISFPQLSIPFISWNRNEPLRNLFNVRVLNPFSGFGKRIDPKPSESMRNRNEVATKEKIIPVTPHAAYYDKFSVTVQPLPDSKIWNTFLEIKPGTPTIRATTYHPNLRSYYSNDHNFQSHNNDKPNEDNVNHLKKSFKEVEKGYTLAEEEINKIFNVEVATDSSDYTTESTTEYESTTEDLSGLNRSGVNGHVVATLLGG